MLLQDRASHFDVDNIHQLVVVNHHPCYGVSDITGTLLYLDVFVFDPHELQLTNLWPGVFFSYFSSFFLEPHEKNKYCRNCQCPPESLFHHHEALNTKAADY